jgi:hypothetical protein
MPGSQNPGAFLLENPLKMYRDCIRMADFLANKQGLPRQVLRQQVTAPWRRHQHETDEALILQHREAAVRGLTNYMMLEAGVGAKDGVKPLVDEDAEETK